MLTIALLLITGSTCIIALFRPWVGVCAYYVLGLLSPQHIWPWIFNDLPISMAVSASTLLGFLLAVASGNISFVRYRNSQTYCVIGLWVLAHLSHLFSPYAGHSIPSNMFSPGFILDLFNTMVLFYLIAVGAIDSQRKLRFFAMVIVAVSIYFTYWANMQYLTGGFWQHQIDGRLRGPGSIYADTNAFALMFVTAMPFIFYMAVYIRNKLIKFSLWITIPFLWHAVFLTGSRGGLLSLAIVTLFIGWRFRSKVVSVALLAALILSASDQGGMILNRTENTIAKEQTATEAEALDPRVVSWKVGLEIISDYPLLGVGTGQFQQATPDYGYEKGLVAHNTLLQFSVDSGVISGLLYLFIFYYIFLVNRRDKVRLSLKTPSSLTDITREATSTSLLGFFVGSQFLNLMLFEPFYYLLAVFLITTHLRHTNAIPADSD
ncbi:O-antigen ligase family protein [Marinobacter changyiensis]|uniref:O-antigen ligase family protein n=1 Tax=Marinobacter changyiensis TaxID=2604091 RepID=UPI0012643FDC|nr:O-antigen ligase family protein [Marinobacter changyiensis]